MLATKPRRSTVIEPTRGWVGLRLGELFEYRDLLYFLVKRDISVLYKQTVLGFAWAILRPVISMVIFTFVFGNLAKIRSDGVPYAIFSYVALVPWTYFSGSLTTSSLSLVSNSSMLTKVYFSRLVFPLTPVFAQLVDFSHRVRRDRRPDGLVRRRADRWASCCSRSSCS